MNHYTSGLAGIFSAHESHGCFLPTRMPMLSVASKTEKIVSKLTISVSIDISQEDSNGMLVWKRSAS